MFAKLYNLGEFFAVSDFNGENYYSGLTSEDDMTFPKSMHVALSRKV